VRLTRALAVWWWQSVRLIGALLYRRWDWRTCWRSVDFWLAIATLVLPFGFALLALHWKPVRARVLPRR
jgi:hypothetical protein